MIRLIFTGLIMFIFTILLVTVDLIIALFLLPFPLLRQNVTHRSGRIWGSLIFMLSGSRVEIEGLENYDTKKTYIIMPNHQSAFDIFLFFKVFKGQFRWISKDFYFKVPFVGWGMYLAGYIPLKREKLKSAYDSILKAGKHLINDISVIIFPEGTRSMDGNIRRFKPGIFLLNDKHKDIPILPVVMDGTIDIMKKGEMKINSVVVRVKILPPVELEKIEGDRKAKVAYLENMVREEHTKMVKSRDLSV